MWCLNSELIKTELKLVGAMIQDSSTSGDEGIEVIKWLERKEES